MRADREIKPPAVPHFGAAGLSRMPSAATRAKTAGKEKESSAAKSEEQNSLEEDLKQLNKEVESKDKRYETLTVRLNKAAMTLREKDEELRLAQGQVASLQSSYDSQQNFVKSLQQTLESMNNEGHEIRARLRTAQQDLKLCRDDLFRLQPDVQTPDTEIVKQLDDLCHRTSSWVDEEISAFELANPGSSQNAVFLGSQDERAVNLLQSMPEAGEFLMRCAVHLFIVDTLMSKDEYLLNLNPKYGSLLREIEKSMASTYHKGNWPG